MNQAGLGLGNLVKCCFYQSYSSRQYTFSTMSQFEPKKLRSIGRRCLVVAAPSPPQIESILIGVCCKKSINWAKICSCGASFIFAITGKTVMQDDGNASSK